MSLPKLLLHEPETDIRARASTHGAAIEFGWTLLGLVGIALAAVGATDLVLAWLPPNFGNPEWEFGTVTAVLNGLPVMTMGLVFLMAWAIARGGRWTVRGLALLFLALALAIAAAALLYATTLPLALRSVDNPVILTGLKKAAARTAVQALVYPVIFVIIAIRSWRRTAVRG